MTTVTYRYDFADEFVAKNAAEVVITAEDFDVGVADAGEADLDECPVGTEFGEWFFDGDEFAVRNLEGFQRGWLLF